MIWSKKGITFKTARLEAIPRKYCRSELLFRNLTIPGIFLPFFRRLHTTGACINWHSRTSAQYLFADCTYVDYSKTNVTKLIFKFDNRWSSSTSANFGAVIFEYLHVHFTRTSLHMRFIHTSLNMDFTHVTLHPFNITYSFNTYVFTFAWNIYNFTYALFVRVLHLGFSCALTHAFRELHLHTTIRPPTILLK